MCSSHNSSLSGIPEPFPFSAFHFLRTCNRLLIPTDLRPYYNSNNKDSSKSLITDDCLNETGINKIIIPELNTNHSDLSSINSNITKQTNGILPTILPQSQQLQSSGSALNPSRTYDFSSSSDLECSQMTVHNRISGEFNYPGTSSFITRRHRGEKRPIPDEQKDEKYYERRKRNNEAAKKSRDARKLREDRIAFRAAILEQENAILRAQLISLREEMAVLRQIIGTSRPAQISVNL